MISSAFGKVLQELAESQQAFPRCRPDAGGVAGSALPRGWSRIKTAKGGTSQTTASHAYFEEANTTQQDRAPLEDRMTLDDLKARIRGGLTKQQIAKLRRDFARQHHPDRRQAPDRELTTELMAKANNLLDGAGCSARSNS